MKYYEFSKLFIPLRCILIISNIFMCLVYPFFIWMLILVLMGGVSESETSASVILLMALYASSLAILIYNTVSLKGVFVFDDHIEIKNGLFPRRFRNVDIDDILDVRYSQSFMRDEDARRFTHFKNIIAGNVRIHCVKIKFARGGWQFVGVDNPEEIVEDIRLRKEKVGG